MLDLDTLDLGELCMALEDNSPEHAWWLDPRSGELEFWPESEPPEEGRPEERGLLCVEPISSSEGYTDMEDFAEHTSDVRARELLLRAIAGRGAFRRFKDTLLEFPEVRETWCRFHDVRMERRAIEWLCEHELIAAEAAERALAAAAPIPAPPAELRDPRSIASDVADELGDLYGARLRQVLLFGSYARGDAHPESDIDLLVVLDDVQSRREELNRMNEILWRHSLEHGTVITELPVSEAEYRSSDEPILIRARTEGLRIA